MTTIRLGVGVEAVEVESGSAVRLVRAAAVTGNVDIATILKAPESDAVFVLYKDGGGIAIDPATGRAVEGGYPGIDLAALRRERAPKAETAAAWSHGQLGATFDGGKTWLIGESPPSQPAPPKMQYWTALPGNTPEKQAAFDAAVSAWRDDWAARMEKPGSGPAPQIEMDLFRASGALGYGAKR